MSLPLDNLGSVAMRDASAGNITRTDPVVEFARRKSSVAADSFNSFSDHSVIDDASTKTREIPQLPIDLPVISLPRDRSKPLVTSNDRYAKEALESYKSLRTRLIKSQAAQGFRSIAVSSVARAEGKTLTAFNLACCCAHVENLSVLLIDGDLRNRSLTKLIAGLPSVGLADVMSAKASCEEAIVRTDFPNLYVMGAGTSGVSSTELFSTEKWSEVIRWSRQHFRIVLVDALSMAHAADFELLEPECDGILLVVRARTTPREALKTAVEQIDGNKLVGIVWNGQ